MRARMTKVGAVIAALALAPTVNAHELSCEEAVGRVLLDGSGGVVLGEGGLPVFDGPLAPVHHVDRYPAVLGVRVTLVNEAADASVVAESWSKLFASAAAAAWYGDAFEAGSTLPVGGAAVAVFTVAVPDRAACLALAGGGPVALAAGEAVPPPAAPAVCRDDFVEDRFVASHELGSAECRARIVCHAPAAAAAWAE